MLKTDEHGFVENEARGKMGNRKLSCDLTDSVKDHIKSFPIMESHYVRARSNRQYLSSSLSLRKMFDHYLERNQGKTCVSQTYLNIFNFNFNLGFHKPKKDVIDVLNSKKMKLLSSKQNYSMGMLLIF